MKSQIVATQWWNKFLPNKIKFTILHQLEIKVDKSQQNHGYRKGNRGGLTTSLSLTPDTEVSSTYFSIIKRIILQYLLKFIKLRNFLNFVQ